MKKHILEHYAHNPFFQKNFIFFFKSPKLFQKKDKNKCPKTEKVLKS